MQYWSLTDPGCVRSQNQDACRVEQLDKNSVLCSGTDFGENVLFHLSCVEANYENFCTYAADLTGGKRAPILTGTTFAPMLSLY